MNIFLNNKIRALNNKFQLSLLISFKNTLNNEKNKCLLILHINEMLRYLLNSLTFNKINFQILIF